MKSILLTLLIFPTLFAASQAKLVINGAVINITNGAALIIDNPDRSNKQGLMIRKMSWMV